MVLCATSPDGGETWSKPTTVCDVDPIGRCGVAILDSGALAVCWLEMAENLAHVRVARVSSEGKVLSASTVARTAAGRSSGVPEIVASGDGLVVAWRDVSARRVRTARVSW